MEATTQENKAYEPSSNGSGSIVLRTETNLTDKDLTEQAKEQFSNHTEILSAHQLSARNVLADNRLSPIGRHLFCSLLEKNYANCKNVLNYVAAHRESQTATESMRAPIIICGLPRTGTTLLYNLLACDSACRAPLYTDMAEPLPPLARSDTSRQMERNLIVSAQSDMLKALGLTDYERETSASHPTFAYDEDYHILAHAGVNTLHYMLLPSKENELATWILNNTNKDFVYDYHKTFIQMLNSTDAPRSHWLLKAPLHILYVDTLLRHYPTASFIMNHRRLEEVLPSCARLATVFTSAFFDMNRTDAVTNRNTAVELMLHLIDTLIRRLVDFRLANRDTPVLDILYDDLLIQPIETVRRIYDYFKLTWSDDFESAMLAWLRDNPQGKQGRLRYTLEEFGLERETINKRYEEYNNTFLKTRDQPCQKD